MLALDVDDYNADEMYVEVHHRPEDGTPLKNQEKAEREVNLHEWVAKCWTTTSPTEDPT